MPMGPGDKRRDDSCAYGAVEKPPPARCESGGDEHRNDGGVCLWPLRERRATCADVVRGCRARRPRSTPPTPSPPTEPKDVGSGTMGPGRLIIGGPRNI